MTEAAPSLLAVASVPCPKCHEMFAWLGDHGASISLYGACLLCARTVDGLPLITCVHAPEAFPEIRTVVALREEREQRLGRRVFPCFAHTERGCARCGGRGWIIGVPPSPQPAVDSR